MKNKITWIYLIVIVLLLSSCSAKENEVSRDINETGDKVVNQQDSQRTVVLDSDKEVPNGVSEKGKNADPDTSNDVSLPDDANNFSRALQFISFSGIDDKMGGRSYKPHEFSEFPLDRILHHNEFGIHFDMKTKNKDEADELLKQIVVEGTSRYTLKEDPEKSGYYHLRLQVTDKPITIKLGDMPTIKVDRLQPLQMKVERQGFARPAIVTETEIASVKISELEQRLILKFTEPMNTSINLNNLPSGEWLDDQTYKLEIERTILPHIEGETIIPLDQFIAKSSNYLPYNMAGIILNRVKELTWLDIETHERVGWSEQDYLYQSMVFSPDRSQYVGVAAMPYDNGHNMDHVYALVLERQGMPPYIIEEGIDALPQSGSPVQWIDDQQLLYNDTEHIYAYDLGKKERRLVHDWSDKGRSFQQVAYDCLEDRLLIISIKPDKQSDDYRYLYDKFIYTNLDQLFLHEENFTHAKIIQWPGLPQMPVHITANGYYWTLKKNDQFITRFEGRDGTIEEVPGVVVFADNEIIILNEETKSDNVLKQALYIWKKGHSPQKTADPPGYIQMVGQKPIVKGENENFQYDWSTDSWILWEKQNYGLFFSPQEKLGMYKNNTP